MILFFKFDVLIQSFIIVQTVSFHSFGALEEAMLCSKLSYDKEESSSLPNQNFFWVLILELSQFWKSDKFLGKASLLWPAAVNQETHSVSSCSSQSDQAKLYLSAAPSAPLILYLQTLSALWNRHWEELRLESLPPEGVIRYCWFVCQSNKSRCISF